MDDIEDMDQKVLREWIRRGLAKADKRRTQAELASKLGRDRSAVSKILGEKRDVKAHEIRIISEYIEEPAPFTVAAPIATPLPDANIATYLSDVAAGVWRDMSMQAIDPIEEVRKWPAIRYAQFDQFYLRVADDSCNLYAKNGEYIWVVKYDEARSSVQHNDYVVVERQQSVGEKYLSEWTVRRIIRTGGLITLRGLSTIAGLCPDINLRNAVGIHLPYLVIARGEYNDY